MFAVAQTRRQRGTAHKATQRTVHLCHGAESKTLTALRRFRQPLLCSAGAAAVAVLAVRRALCREGAARPEGARVRAKDVVEVNGEGYRITFDATGGPGGIGRVVVAPRGSTAPTSRDFSKFLYSVTALAEDHKEDLGRGFVAIFDSSELVFPSMLSIPQIISVVRDQPPPASLRASTRAIAVVAGDSRWNQMIVANVVDMIAAVTKLALVPVFASSLDAADKMLRYEASRTGNFATSVGASAICN
mmetsp:Transcript_164854/g.529065  ORF Transcript_164854/g.529065 Transcript_164854/m.529065 type:complete len:246 (-) Transcript_164854:385-1122(-)